MRRDVCLHDLMPLFERTMIEEFRPYARHNRWTDAEAARAIGTADEIGAEFVRSLEDFARYVEREDWDELVALAKREQTRRLIRGGR